MKKLFVIFALLMLSNLVFGQKQLPVAVSNIKVFPLPRGQRNIGNCTHFALTHYLKSAIRNRYYGLDPLLKENQFNENFVWDQNIDPIYRNSDVESDFEFMKDQGCATAADFEFDETNDQILPSLDVRVKALAFKSKAIHKMYICRENGLDLLNEQMQALRDSLSQGICFVSTMYLYNNFMSLNQNYNVYNCDYDTNKFYDRINHAATIIGYNDTIRTANGRGAFLVLNSNDSPGKAIFWFPYEWYYSKGFSFDIFFLEEDFSSSPAKLTLNLKLSNLVTAADISEGRYLFTDTVFVSDGKRVDHLNRLDYIYRRNEIKLLAVNNKKISENDQARVFFPLNSNNGSYQILKDLSDLSKPEDFKSLKVLFSDPISAIYIGENGETIYSFTREAKGVVNDAYVSFIETGKKIVAKIKNLPDTTLVTENFLSYFIPWHWLTEDKPFPYGFVKSCTSKVKRQLITFTVEEAPIFVDAPQNLEVVVNQTLTYTFKAKDNENRPITYYLQNPSSEATMSSNGKLTFKSGRVGTSKFTVVASNSVAIATNPVTVKVGPYTDVDEDIEVPDNELRVYPNPMISNTSIEFSLAKRGRVNIVIFDSVGRLVETIINQECEAGQQTVYYDSTNLKFGVYIFRLTTDNFAKSLKIVKH